MFNDLLAMSSGGGGVVEGATLWTNPDTTGTSTFADTSCTLSSSMRSYNALKFKFFDVLELIVPIDIFVQTSSSSGNTQASVCKAKNGSVTYDVTRRFYYESDTSVHITNCYGIAAGVAITNPSTWNKQIVPQSIVGCYL